MTKTLDPHLGPPGPTLQKDPTVLGMVGEQAARTPDSVAVVVEGCRVTYRELLERSGTLACRLAGEQVGPGAIVGFVGGRSIATLVGLLGILRTGAAYLTLDPDQPPERLAFIVRDAGVRALVTDASPPGLEALVPLVMPVEDGTAGHGGDWRAPAVSPSDPAYVIYTFVHHGAFANFLCSMRREPGIETADRIAALTTSHRSRPLQHGRRDGDGDAHEMAGVSHRAGENAGLNALGRGRRNGQQGRGAGQEGAARPRPVEGRRQPRGDPAPW
ncbi:MAG: hypothetical protein EHM24_22570 [Acidobacteria bacterium]|nr:MAG: hypothetical protein EHM24_22570 [Acidobacteriota bacterium]